MSEEHQTGSIVNGTNPHYCPPVMRWNRVEIEVPAGYKLIQTADTHGDLCLRLYAPTDIVEPQHVNSAWLFTMPPGKRCFVIENDDKGPPVDHAFNPDERDICRTCGGDACGWKEP